MVILSIHCCFPPPKECFDFATVALDLAIGVQTPVLVMSDLELGMNDNLSEPLEWDDAARYDRGKVLDAEQLEQREVFGRYLDVDGDGIGYRTLPGTHPEKGAFFTRGTSRMSLLPIPSHRRRTNAICSA